ncbi:VOC family protein [Acidithiobacillus sp. YTS05]|nr:VOC family protein [Acidithiobacillus sp. YTS05]
MNQTTPQIDSTFVVFDANGTATPMPVTPDFWNELNQRFGDFSGRTLVSSFHFAEDWPTWECHPHGDEWIGLLDGDFEQHMDLPDGHDGPRQVRLNTPGEFVIVPRGVWHTAKIRAPSTALFVTPGEGTLTRTAEQIPAAATQKPACASMSPALSTLRLNQLNLVCRDIDATLAFYRALGLPIHEAPRGADGIRHARASLPDGVLLEFDNETLARVYNAGWRQHAADMHSQSRSVIGFMLATRADVDRHYAALIDAGYAGRQCPFDAFWGARYAIVADPDGRDIGLMSPLEAQRRSWPPMDSPEP